MVSSYGSFCTSFHVVTYGAFFEFINLCLWHIRCVWYIRRKKFFLCYIGRCLFYLSSNFYFKNIMRWQKTSGLANQSSPTLTTPKCIKYQKISYIYLFCICTRRFELHGATDSLAICSSGKWSWRGCTPEYGHIIKKYANATTARTHGQLIMVLMWKIVFNCGYVTSQD